MKEKQSRWDSHDVAVADPRSEDQKIRRSEDEEIRGSEDQRIGKKKKKRPSTNNDSIATTNRHIGATKELKNSASRAGLKEGLSTLHCEVSHVDGVKSVDVLVKGDTSHDCHSGCRCEGAVTTMSEC